MKPIRRWDAKMMQEVAAALEGIDVLLLMVDASRMLPHADDLLLEKAKRFRGKTILALNKVDRLAKPKLLPLIDSFCQGLRVCGDRAHLRAKRRRMPRAA